jgi:hypothetical protein
VTVNPIAEAVKRLPNSRSTYFCLKSILKHNRRRFTLVTPEELQSLTHAAEPDAGDEEQCTCDGCRAELERPGSLRIGKRQRPSSCQSLSFRIENSRWVHPELRTFSRVYARFKARRGRGKGKGGDERIGARAADTRT